jgi:nanoRNase/pAp phosphatase (c-di-AMP/oligoRNAs hydrolase)
VDANISERTATAMLYAIKSDTLFFNRQTNRVDIEAFSYLYPLADAALIRKMEGAEITAERLDYVMKAHAGGKLVDQVFCSFLGTLPREDFVPYVADFFLQLEHVKWTVIAGVVHDSLIISVRNLGYSKNAGEFVRRFFADIGNAGGHRAMAKAVIPYRAFAEKFAVTDAQSIASRLQEIVAVFLHETPKDVKPNRSDVKNEREEIKVR